MPDRYLGRHLGRFRVDAIVGSGGFAWVYKGYDPELDIPVAIKVLKPQFAGEATFETRFRHEASIAAKLRHPNIIRILAVGREGTAVYFVMDFLPTGLDGRLEMLGTLPETLLIRMGMDVAAALAFAHREGVIHRDIKTDNILFDEHGNAIVADFGIARAVSGYVDQTGTNMVVGTPQYFSPEQARGQTLDGRADIYSLGVTLFRASAGVLPFRGDDWYEIARQHVEDRAAAAARVQSRALGRGGADHPQVPREGSERPVSHRRCAAHGIRAAAGPREHTGGAAREAGRSERQCGVRHHAQQGEVASLSPRHGRGGAAAVIGVAAVVWNALRPAAPAPVTSGGEALAPVTVSAPAMSASDSAPAAVTKAGAHVLRVHAPAGAEVSIDGNVVGTGSWKSDSIAPGAHTVSASVHAIPGCNSARQEVKTKVLPTGTTNVTITPRECGYFSLDALPAAANFTLAGPTGSIAAHGAVAKVKPLVVPVGKYTLHVTAPYCAEFRGAATISAGKTRRERVRLICK